MALIGNYSVLNKSPQKWMGGSTTSAEVQVRSAFNKAGAMRNRMYGDMQTAAKPLYGIPDGQYLGSTWMIPQKSGRISSINQAYITISPSGSGAMGAPISGSTTINITATGTGGLITSGSGSAAMTITATGSILATVSTTGSSSFAITTNTPLLGALGWVQGNTTITFSASLTAYAKGYMTGSTVDSSVLTVDNIAAGILAASTTSPIYADIRKVNSYNVTGNGQTGTEWGPM
jgi:hypothetical protein